MTIKRYLFIVQYENNLYWSTLMKIRVQAGFFSEIAAHHESKNTQSWFEMHIVTTLQWHNRFSDITHIENFYYILAGNVYNNESQFNCFQAFERIVQEGWEKIPFIRSSSLICNIKRGVSQSFGDMVIWIIIRFELLLHVVVKGYFSFISYKFWETKIILFHVAIYWAITWQK